MIGIPDIQLARESRPGLSTVAVPTDAAAAMAVELLEELIRGNVHAARTLRIAPTPVLVPQSSTGPARR